MKDIFDFMFVLIFVVVIICTTALNIDMPIEKAVLSQELCIKANSRAVSFDRVEVTCENKAIIPLKGE